MVEPQHTRVAQAQDVRTDALRRVADAGKLTFSLSASRPEAEGGTYTFDLPPATYRFIVPPRGEFKPVCAVEGHVFWAVHGRRWCGRCGIVCD